MRYSGKSLSVVAEHIQVYLKRIFIFEHVYEFVWLAALVGKLILYLLANGTSDLVTCLSVHCS